ncbi:MAG: M56 family metallopeptidase [Candidatus Omnitrophica bacterium]|nr:M56 family metallopeptidase [Candidatus Omnitrophota bacterium]
MVHYFLSFQPIGFFFFVLISTFLIRRRHPYLCYLLWISVLIKLVLPFGFFERNVTFAYWDLEVYEKISVLTHEEVRVQSQPLHEYDSTRELVLTSENESENHIFAPSQPTGEAPRPSAYQLEFWNPVQIGLKFFFPIWIGISLFLLVAKGIQFLRQRFAVASMPELKKGFVYQQYLQCVKMVGLSFVPVLRVAPENFKSPCALGVRKKHTVVVIPNSLLISNDLRKIRIIVCHELVHVKKRDPIVNLLRVACMILFHFHPLRLIADRFIDAFQEITTDLKSIELLQIDKGEYVRVLLAKFMELDKSNRSLSFSVPFLEGELSFVKRLFYLKRYEPRQKKPSKFLFYPFLTAAVLCFLIQFSLFNSMAMNQSLIIGDNYVESAFPEPREVSPRLVHERGGSAKIYRDRLWILEPRYGLYVFQMDDAGRWNLSASYTFEQVGDDNTDKRANDFALDGDYVYFAVGDVNPLSFVNSRIDILKMAPDDSLTKVGEIASSHPHLLHVFHHSLWAAGSSDMPTQGMIQIFNIESPQTPSLIDYEFYDVLPSVLAPIDHEEGLIVSIGQEIQVFHDETTLFPQETLQLDQNAYWVGQLEDGTVLALSVENSGLSGKNFFIHTLNRRESNRFAVESSIQVFFEEAGDNAFFFEPIIFFNNLLSPVINHGAVLLDASDGHVRLIAQSDKSYEYLTIFQNKIISLYPETTVFYQDDFKQKDNNILAWRMY